MTPELTYINNNIEAYCFGKSLLQVIHTNDVQKMRILEKEFLSDFFKLPKERVFFLEQMHSSDCIRITDFDISRNHTLFYAKADAMITQLKNVVLCIRTADCLPIFFHSNSQKKEVYVGVMHCGWRGISKGIIQNTISLVNHSIEKMIYEYKIQKKDPNELIDYPITIFSGIYIPETIYEVGKEVADLFPFIKKQHGKYYLNLWENSQYIFSTLKASSKFQISDPFDYLNGDKTKIFENFFSHRRGDLHRNLNVIYIKNKYNKY